MKANTKYDKKIADRFHDTSYYECNEYDTKNQDYMSKEVERLKTDNKENVTGIIDEKRSLGEKEEKVFTLLRKIYEKNKNAVFGILPNSRRIPNSKKNPNKEIFNSDLINIVSSVPLLITAYAKVRKNAGSTTLAYRKSNTEYNKLDPDQKNLLNKNHKGSDGIDLKTFQETARLLKLGKYPWGISKRIWSDKPGEPGAKRPLTIPSFMDRVVQEAIKQILVAIYEPTFDKMNVSYGFRPNRSSQDAIYRLTNIYKSQGLNKALEGDIKSAYDKVNREKLLEILGKKIKDKKFIGLIKDRLDYEYYDKEQKVYIKDKEGIPQGGTDTPYLWNIYMLEFDEFIITEIQNLVDNINKNNRKKTKNKEGNIENLEKTKLTSSRTSIKKILKWIRKYRKINGTFKEELKKLNSAKLSDWKTYDPMFKTRTYNAKTILKNCDIENSDEKTIIKKLQTLQKSIEHKIRNVPHHAENKRRYRFIYTRYADDWIILTNMKTEIIKLIKEKITIYLKEKLDATLSDEKTLITDITVEPAHFLGFEIRTYKKNKNKYILVTKKKDKQKDGETTMRSGSRAFAGVDKQRLIDRLHMKGYCDKKGRPKEITKLNNLEAFTIIDRTNSVLRGLVNYYVKFIKSPKSQLSRWIYIIRYSCLKTLALKHKTTIRKIFKKYKTETPSGTKTIEDTVTIEINNEKFTRTWKLYTEQILFTECRGKTMQLSRKQIQDRFWNLEKGTPENYEEKNKNVTLKNEDFLERINWVNIRTSASFDLPCCICGCEENIEMHHIKHVRKVKYDKINKEKTSEQIMGLKNRRQIPVCRTCHMNIIHKGNYERSSLKQFSIDKMYDNRIVNVESYIHKGKPDVNYKKTLIEKGWKKYKDQENINEN